MNADNLILKLTDKINDGYVSLAKWLISLSSGTIVFSVNLLKQETSESLSTLLILGLTLLVLTILLGVFYVRFGIDCLHYNLMCIGIDEEKRELENTFDPEDKRNFRDTLDKTYEKQMARRKRINKIMLFSIPLLTWSFILGIALVALFGYGQLKYKKPITTSSSRPSPSPNGVGSGG